MLSALFGTRPQAHTDLTWGEWTGDNVSGGTERVDQTTAMQLMAVHGSVRLISDGISTLPLDMYRRDGSQQKNVAAPMWLKQPTPQLTFESWCGQVLVSLLLHGNAYVLVKRGRASVPVTLEPMDPQKVTVTRENGRVVFTVNGNPTKAEILHIKGLMLPGADEGLSPIEYARRTVGLGLSALRFGSEFFEGEGSMPGVIQIPHPVQPDTMKDIARQWQRKRKTGGRGLPGVLQNGAQWQQVGINNEQAQFLSTRAFSAAEIAGQMFMLDPSDLGIPVEGTSLTYANLQDRNTRRVQVTFLPWIVRLEAALTSLVGPNKFVKLNVDGLLRGDQKSRYEAYSIAIKNQFLTPNEARDFEDWAPLAGGDQVVKAPVPVVPEPQPANVINLPSPSPDMANVMASMADRPQVTNISPVVNIPPPDVTVHVSPPEVNVAPPVVNVAPPEIHVAPPEVTVNMPAPKSRRIEHDADGRIVRVIEEE